MSFDRWMHNFCFFRGIFAFFFGKFRIIFCTNFAIYFLINFRIFATFCISYFAKISHFFAKQKEAKFSHWYEKFLRNYFPFPLETLNITNKRMDNNSWHFIDKNVVLIKYRSNLHFLSRYSLCQPLHLNTLSEINYTRYSIPPGLRTHKF